MESLHILVIEDDNIVARTIERSLRNNNHQITLANRGDKGLDIARKSPPDLVILDVIMPDMDGYAVCRAMRADPLLAHVPVLFLTAKVKPQDRINGFTAGADDYLCKPFNVEELVLRVQAILWRTLGKPQPETAKVQMALPAEEADLAQETPSHCLVVGNHVLDTRTFELDTPSKGKIRLTPLQFDLLYHLMTHPGEPFSPARLLDEVWDYPCGRGSPDLVRVHIKTLRERIEINPRNPSFIRTIPGQGYTVSAVSS